MKEEDAIVCDSKEPVDKNGKIMMLTKTMFLKKQIKWFIVRLIYNDEDKTVTEDMIITHYDCLQLQSVFFKLKETCR